MLVRLIVSAAFFENGKSTGLDMCKTVDLPAVPRVGDQLYILPSWPEIEVFSIVFDITVSPVDVEIQLDPDYEITDQAHCNDLLEAGWKQCV